MSQISIKGVLIGALFGFVVGGVLSFVMMFIFSMATGVRTAADILAVYASSPTIALGMATLQWMEVAVVLAAGGYLGAKIARKGPLVNGMLSSFLFVLFGLYSLLNSHQSLLSSAIAIVLAPLLGLLGGYLRLRQTRKILQVQP